MSSLQKFQADQDAHAREVRSLRSQIKRLSKDNERLERQVSFIRKAEEQTIRPPRWAQPRKSARGHRATLGLVISDTHFDEVVKPAEVEWTNAYNREIAERRLRRTFDKTIVVARDYLKGLTYDGLALFLGGDLVSGNIHEELSETNEGFIMETILHWTEQLNAGIRMLAEEFGNVRVLGVPGNHGRRTRKPRSKGRAQDNFDWLICKLLERDFRGDERLSFIVPPSADAMCQIYDTRFLLTHGDQFRGGDGIAGIFSPISRGHFKKVRRQAAARRPYDWLLMGHFHQYVFGKGWIVNGSLKGYDEYAYQNNFEPEPPQQALFTVTPEHGITFSAPILPGDRKAEGW